jgi:hypothetical protein
MPHLIFPLQRVTVSGINIVPADSYEGPIIGTADEDASGHSGLNAPP